MKLLENKTAFITGGSRGIGAAMVRRFAEHGANVAFSYRERHEAANELLREIAVHGKKYRAFPCDAADADAVRQTMEVFYAEFGELDILVNNAGIIRDALLPELSEKDWRAVLDMNLTSAFLHTQIALKTMIRRRSGSIINIASVSGLTGREGQANYAASKAGLIGLSKSVAREAGPRNVRCNVIAPGFIQTEMTAHLTETKARAVEIIPLRRVGLPEEVADVAVFLASDLARYVTGQTLGVCGGLL